jgi:hypothetical protein
MSRFEEAVEHDLATAADPPPIEHVRRRARRQRARWVASGLVPVLALVAALAIVVTNNTRRSVDVSTATSRSTTAPTAAPTTTLPPAVAALPVATDDTFPELTRVLDLVRSHESDGRVDYGEIVATTRDKTYALFGGRTPVDTRPIYFVRLVGTFTCNGCSVPPGAVAPHGNEILFTVTVPQTQPPNDVFEVGSRAVDLSTFGTVYRLPLAVSARVVLPTQTMSAGSSISGRVIVENDTGAPLRVAGCGEIFQLALTNDSIKPDVAWRACLQFFTIPVGASSYPVTIRASYNSCSATPQPGVTSCLPDNQPPPLPAGEYHAVLFQSGTVAATPPPLSIEVTP